MTVNTEEEGREGAAGPWGWEARDTRTRPPSGPLPRNPLPRQQVCAPERGLLVLRPGWSPAREDKVGLPPPNPRPSAFLPRGPRRTHLLRAKVALSCGGRGESCLPSARRRPGAPGRRLSARRTPSRVGSRLLPGCGGPAGGARRRDAVRVGRPGTASRAHPPARPSPLLLVLLPLLGPGLRRSLPAGPVSGLSAADPPPGAALRLLRRQRMRRRRLLPASRPPWPSPGTSPPSPAGEELREGDSGPGGAIPPPLPRVLAETPFPGEMMQA